MNKTLLLVVFLWGFCCSQSLANSLNELRFSEENWNSQILSRMLSGTQFLDIGEQFDVLPFPANDSNETKAELDYLHELAQTKRTAETLQKIEYENQDILIVDLFVNEGLVRADDLEMLLLLAEVDMDVQYFVLRYKKHFMRPRPDALDPTLKTAIPNPGHPAYPSGHATETYAMAILLADFDPDNAGRYYQFAKDVAHRREIAGVHYPSDSEAGQKLAVEIVERLHQNPAFEERYQAVKKNFKKHEKMGGQTHSK